MDGESKRGSSKRRRLVKKYTSGRNSRKPIEECPEKKGTKRKHDDEDGSKKRPEEIKRRRVVPRTKRTPNEEQLKKFDEKFWKIIQRRIRKGRDADYIDDDSPSRWLLSEEEKEEDQRGGLLEGGTVITLCTWNMEKFGVKTVEEIKQAKAKMATKILDLYHPTFFIMQEVTNATLFGKYVLQQPIDRYFESLSELTKEDYKEIRKDRKKVEKEEEEEEEKEKEKEREEVEQMEIDVERIKQGLQNFTVSGEYCCVNGPMFESAGGANPEYYPLYYDKTVVIGTPEPFIYDEEQGALVQCPKVIKYGKGNQSKPRPLLVWRCTIMMESPNQASDDSMADQYEPAEILIGVVHTSPGLAKIKGPTVCQQVKAIIKIAAKIQKKENKPFLLGGDFYAQQFKTVWNKLEKHDQYILMAPEKHTNYPEGSVTSGQIADHFLTIQSMTPLNPKRKTMTVSRDLPYALEEHKEDENTEEELSRIYEIKADHCPVLVSVVLKME